MKFKIICCLALICMNVTGCASSSPKKLNMATLEKDPKYHYNMALFNLNNKNFDEAIKSLNRSLALDPRYYLSVNALGLTYSMKGELDVAVAQFEKCLQINPSFSEARNNLGSVLQEMGQLDRAEQEFIRAAEDPRYNTRELPLYNLARLDFIRKNYDKALLRVDTVIKINARFAAAHNLRGMILEVQDRLNEAISSYKSAVKYLPEDANFNLNLALALIKNKEINLAKEILEKIEPLTTDPLMREKINAIWKEIKKQEE